MLLRLRLWLIRQLVGKLSIVANTTLDGSVLVGSGAVWNCFFMRHKLASAGNVYCGRVVMVPDSRGQFDRNIFDNGDGRTIYARPGQSLAEVEAEHHPGPGDTVYVTP